MQYPRTNQLSTALQPPPTYAPQAASDAHPSDHVQASLGNGDTFESLQNDRQSFAMAILQTQAFDLYQATLYATLYKSNPLLLPSVDSMKNFLQEIKALDDAPKGCSRTEALYIAFFNYFSWAKVVMESTADYDLQQQTFGLEYGDAARASYLSSCHATCQKFGWDMFQASIHYAFQAHRLCNLSEDAKAAELKMSSTSEEPVDTLHQLLVARQEYGIQLTGLAFLLMVEHQHLGDLLCMEPRIYSLLDINNMHETAVQHYRALCELEAQVNSNAIDPARHLNRVRDAADKDLRTVSSSLENLANDRLLGYEIDAIAAGGKLKSDLKQSHQMWQSISSELIPLPVNEIKSRIFSHEEQTRSDLDKTVESFRSQLSYFFESRLDVTSSADEQAESKLLESYAYLYELVSERRDATTVIQSLSSLGDSFFPL